MVEITRDDALIVVDMQNDFITGSLAVPDAEAIVPNVKNRIEVAHDAGAMIIFTKDWHPANHSSFKGYGGEWPPHCVRRSQGAEFHPEIKAIHKVVEWSSFTFEKGVEAGVEQYSVFYEVPVVEGDLFEVPVHELMLEGGVERVFVCGLATDFCVKATTLDALKLGWPVFIMEQCIRGVFPDKTKEALAEMVEAGAILI
jgi:nicotinamidase/pyrazinamidase